VKEFLPPLSLRVKIVPLSPFSFSDRKIAMSSLFLFLETLLSTARLAIVSLFFL